MSERPFTQRQTPAPGEIFLDHVGWYVPVIEPAAALIVDADDAMGASIVIHGHDEDRPR